MANNNAAYQPSTSITCTLASLASSSTLVAGRSSATIDNTSGLYLDRPLTGKFRTGTTPTAGVIEVWLIPYLSDGPTFFDTFDGTDKAITVTTRGMLISYGILLATIQMDSTTTGKDFDFYASVAAKVGSLPPKKYQLFVTHNTVAALDSTGANHVITEISTYVTTA
jgi:hypothetical protein